MIQHNRQFEMQTINYQALVHELPCIGDWIRFAASCFQRAGLHFGHGADNAWDEAVQLIMQLLHLPIDCDPIVFHATLITNERCILAQAIEERITMRRPVPYITHRAWSMGLSFYVDERVLIPRSPLAEWIHKCFQPWIDAAHVRHILEIGTGSGCLAVASALAFPHAWVDAIDVESNALSVARINAAEHGVEGRIRFLQGDCFEPLDGLQKYDIIFSNPPYVGAEELSTLPPEYLHEPRIALEAQDNGLAIVKRLMHEAQFYLHERGILIVEVGYSEEALLSEYPHLPFIWLEQEHGGVGLFLLTKDILDTL